MRVSLSCSKLQDVTQFELVHSLCKKSSDLCRSAIMFSRGCTSGSSCRQKEPVPQEKIYKERTIEVGVYIDKALYNLVSVSTNMTSLMSYLCFIHSERHR